MPGYHIKETIRQFLENAGYPWMTWVRGRRNPWTTRLRKAVADCVAAHQDAYGIALCGTGMGIAIAANKVPGIRAAVAHNVDTARLAREHNDANVLAMGGRVVNGAEAIEMVQTFLNTTFAGGRHARRVEKIMQIEAAERG